MNGNITRTMLLFALLSPGVTGAAHPATQLDRETAIETALRRNLSLRIAEVELDAARGRVQSARVLFSENPEISAGVADRSSPDDRSTDLEFSISQHLELPGRRGHRIDAAEAELASLAARVEHLRVETVRDVSIAFMDALLADKMKSFADDSVQLAVQLLEVATVRRDAGDATDLEVNMANIRRARAERSLLRSELRRTEKLAELRRLLALGEGETIMLSGEVSPPPGVTVPLSSLMEQARVNRKDLMSLAHISDARDAEAALARSEAFSGIGLSASYGQEAGVDDITGVGISLRLPLFNRQKGRIAEARAESSRARLELHRGSLEVEREVSRAYSRYQVALEEVEIYGSRILAQVDDNLQMLNLSFEAGKIGLLQLVPAQQTLLDTRREYLESIADLHFAWAALDVAVGGNLQ